MIAAGEIRPTRAMVLAAGFGTRMRPITDNLPKPLIEVVGRTLIDRAIDRLADAGVERIVVNLHHLGDKIENHLKARATPEIVFSPEPKLLETGGGVSSALPLLGTAPFYVVNGDIFWLNGPSETFSRLLAVWNEEEMDGMLLLHSTVDAYGYRGKGDFCAEPDGRLTRRPENGVSPWLFTGVQMLHPRLFADAPEGAFSLNLLYDRALEAERLYGIIHDGEWFHIGTPAGLGEAETYLNTRYAGVKHR